MDLNKFLNKLDEQIDEVDEKIAKKIVSRFKKEWKNPTRQLKMRTSLLKKFGGIYMGIDEGDVEVYEGEAETVKPGENLYVISTTPKLNLPRFEDVEIGIIVRYIPPEDFKILNWWERT